MFSNKSWQDRSSRSVGSRHLSSLISAAHQSDQSEGSDSQESRTKTSVRESSSESLHFADDEGNVAQQQLLQQQEEGVEGVEEEAVTAMEFAEVWQDGQKFFEVLVSSFHSVDNGAILGLTCLPSNKGAYVAGCREFPLFLNALSASPIKVAIEKGGLPHALEELERLNEHDLQKIYVTRLDDTRTGGEFLVVDEGTGERKQIISTLKGKRLAPVRKALKVRKQKAFEKALAVQERKQQKARKDLANQDRKKSLKTLY
eukprot:jgi/Mesen1/2312/ME000155S01397